MLCVYFSSSFFRKKTDHRPAINKALVTPCDRDFTHDVIKVSFGRFICI